MRYVNLNFQSPFLKWQWTKQWTKGRRVALVLLLLSVPMFSGCSYITDFVVVNESTNPIELRYKIKILPGPFGPRILPAKMTNSQLREGDKPWQQLDSSQYTLDVANRTLTVLLMPDEALRIERLQRGGMHLDEAEDKKTFSIEELSIKGTSNEIKLQGEEVMKSFKEETRNTYILSYK